MFFLNSLENPQQHMGIQLVTIIYEQLLNPRMANKRERRECIVQRTFLLITLVLTYLQILYNPTI
jgi:hypothetical protein